MATKGQVLLDEDDRLPNGITPFGVLYVEDAVPTAVAVAGTYYKAQGVTETGGFLSDFTHQSPGTLTYVGKLPRFFRVSATASLAAGSNNVTLGMRIAKNGRTEECSTQTVRKGNGPDVVSVSAQSVILARQNDHFEVWLTTDDAGGTVTAEHGTLTAVSL